MKTDRATKVLLLFIALGLWANAFAPLFHPDPVAAARLGQEELERSVTDIAHDVPSIYTGICLNQKICG